MELQWEAENLRKRSSELNIREREIEDKKKKCVGELERAEKLFLEANNRLSTAIQSKDFTEVEVAQSLIEVAKNKMESVRREQIELDQVLKE